LTIEARPLLEVDRLTVWFEHQGGLFRRRQRTVRAVDDIGFSIGPGKTLGLVGESGSGKTTTGRAVVMAQQATSGTIRFEGVDLTKAQTRDIRRLRGRIQMVFQDPFSSLDPRQSIADILSEPFLIRRLPVTSSKVRSLLDLVGLPASFANRFPHQLSGGQLQRVGIARALASKPTLLVCDEPVSALDVSIQAQIINLFSDLQKQLGIAYLFIAHDLAVVRHVADRIAVMYLGRIVETAETDDLFAGAAHPYTIALLSAVPTPDAEIEKTRQRIILAGDAPSATSVPAGCRFRSRCWLYDRLGNPARCVEEDPVLRPKSNSSADHRVACHFEGYSEQVTRNAFNRSRP
jgi:oligopeptide/dipeptide ABC transporter ATP-binding protein